MKSAHIGQKISQSIEPPQPQHELQRALLLDVVVAERRDTKERYLADSSKHPCWCA